MKSPFCKCPLCEYDLLLEKKIFSSKDKDLLPKTRYLQAYVKYSKIKKLAERKEYKDHENNSGRIRDLIKDCLNDMTLSLELKYGKRGKWEKNKWISNPEWETWMQELARLRNHAVHKMTAIHVRRGSDDDGCYLSEKSNLKVVPYLEKTLEKIKAKLVITEI
jgi:hypothetical protein